MQSLAEWSDANSSFVCFRDDPELQGSLVQRSTGRRNTLSHLLAPSVLQHYLVSKTNRHPSGTVDMTLLVQKGFSAEEYRLHEGFDSKHMLKRLLLPGSVVAVQSPSNIDTEFLLTYGPCLVSGFYVHSAFRNESLLCYDECAKGSREQRKDGLHAMVLVGVRVDQNGTKHFLLQNWWPTKQFVSVTQQYLNECLATPLYVTTPQHCFPKNVTCFVNHKPFAKFTLDCPESFPREKTAA
eukprot:c20514_g2_i1.p1 GENE.c20514_g2_i1~~c20514_g2_i1.p1  ORF type:complete len:239 (+),score=29.89 c20514_g2_i1:254-970(+)